MKSGGRTSRPETGAPRQRRFDEVDSLAEPLSGPREHASALIHARYPEASPHEFGRDEAGSGGDIEHVTAVTGKPRDEEAAQRGSCPNPRQRRADAVVPTRPRGANSSLASTDGTPPIVGDVGLNDPSWSTLPSSRSRRSGQARRPLAFSRPRRSRAGACTSARSTGPAHAAGSPFTTTAGSSEPTELRAAISIRCAVRGGRRLCRRRGSRRTDRQSCRPARARGTGGDRGGRREGPAARALREVLGDPPPSSRRLHGSTEIGVATTAPRAGARSRRRLAVRGSAQVRTGCYAGAPARGRGRLPGRALHLSRRTAWSASDSASASRTACRSSRMVAMCSPAGRARCRSTRSRAASTAGQPRCANPRPFVVRTRWYERPSAGFGTLRASPLATSRRT